MENEISIGKLILHQIVIKSNLDIGFLKVNEMMDLFSFTITKLILFYLRKLYAEWMIQSVREMCTFP